MKNAIPLLAEYACILDDTADDEQDERCLACHWWLEKARAAVGGSK